MFIHLFILPVTANFLLLAVKWPKIVVLAVMPTNPLPPPLRLGPLSSYAQSGLMQLIRSSSGVTTFYQEFYHTAVSRAEMIQFKILFFDRVMSHTILKW